VVSLASLLGREGREPRAGDPVLVIEHPAGPFAVTVDAYESPRPIAAQSSAELVFDAPLVRAVAPTPDGGVLLVLDVLALREALFTSAGRAVTAASPSRRRPHVIVAEDSPVARALLSGVLSGLGMRVSAAEDGSAALDVALRDRPDFVLTDIEMPVLDGLSMVARFRQDPALADVPVLVLSDRTDERTRQRAEALGVRGFLAKQRFVEADLREAIEDALGRRR
jgi:CheY-like chemotaxis protein